MRHPNRAWLSAGALVFAVTAALAQSAPATSADTAKGKALVNGDGLTLYTFDNDSKGKSYCNGQCANLWMPLIATSDASASVAAGAQGNIAGGAGVGGCDQWHPEICALTVAIRLALAVVVERVERQAVAVDERFAFRGIGAGRRRALRQSRARDENEKAGNEARPVGSRHNLLPRCSAPTYSTSYSTLAQPSGISRSCGKKRPL